MSSCRSNNRMCVNGKRWKTVLSDSNKMGHQPDHGFRYKTFPPSTIRASQTALQLFCLIAQTLTSRHSLLYCVFLFFLKLVSSGQERLMTLPCYRWTKHKHVSLQRAHTDFKVQFSFFGFCWICKSKSVHNSHRDNNERGLTNGYIINYSISIKWSTTSWYYPGLKSRWMHCCIVWTFLFFLLVADTTWE